MPEGPEIHRIADWIRSAVEGDEILDLRFGQVSMEPHIEALKGRYVEAIEPRGKSITFHMSGGHSIFTHTMLYGRWFVLEPGGKPPGKKKVALSIDTPNHTITLTSTNRVSVHRSHELSTHDFLSRLGPDVLHHATTPSTVRRALEKNESMALGESMMKQSILAGIGNYLRAEILFLAGLHPDTTPSSLDDEALDELCALVVSVPRRAYEAKGFTTSDEYIARGESQGYERKSLKRWVYKKDGQACPTCDDTIVKSEHAKRAFYHCPSCQPFA